MRTIRQMTKPVSLLLTILMLLITAPYESALAVMIGTETVLDGAKGQVQP